MKTGISVTEFMYLQKSDKSHLLSDSLYVALMLRVKQFHVLPFRTARMRELHSFSIIGSLREDVIQGIPPSPYPPYHKPTVYPILGLTEV